MSLNLFWEIFGYIGTGIVIFSMTRTSVVKLRVFNILGSAISFIYAIKMNTLPVVFLNGSLIAINFFQLVKSIHTKRIFNYVKTDAENEIVRYFFSTNKSDIKKFFPSCSSLFCPDKEAHIVYMDNEVAGMIIGKRVENMLIVDLDYATPKFRDLSVASFLFPKIKTDGINILQAKADTDIHQKYLNKMGFEWHNGNMIKKL